MATSVGFDFTTLLNLASYLLFFVFIVYGQRIQFTLTIGSIGRSLNRLERMKDKARKDTIDYLAGKASSSAKDVPDRVDQFLEYVTIMPESLDPSGIVGKIEHITRTGDERVRGEVTNLLAGADKTIVSIAQNILEIAGALNVIHKVVRHFYLTGKKTSSYFTLVQLQMSLPQILEQADALVKAVESIKLGQPIGDGAGPLLASKFMANIPKQMIARDTVMATTEYKGRTLYVLKAEGPTGYVGEPGVAMQRLIEGMGRPLNAIIMVDAALKLEGEDTGEVAQGVGAAIGGIGVDKFQIEEVAAKHKIPVYAVLIKQTEVEAITAMKKQIADAVEKALNIVKRIIEEKTKEGESVLLAGIGNTLGIGQGSDGLS